MGVFYQYSMIDVEDTQVPDPARPGRFISLGDSFDRHASGVLAAYRHPLEHVTIGVTTTVASFNKQTPGDFFNNRDSAWVTVADVQHNFTDNFAVDVYGTFYTLLDNETNIDGTYWIVGADAAYKITENWMISIGYEKTLEYDNYRDNRLNATIAYTW